MNYLFALTILLIGALFCWIPTVRRGAIFFGVRVAGGFPLTPHGQRIVRTFRLQVIWFSLLTALLALFGAQSGDKAALVLAGALQAAAAVLAFLWARRSTLPHATNMVPARSAPLVVARERLPGGILGAAMPFLILLAAAFYLRLHGDQIPAELAARTWRGVYGQLCIAGAMDAVMLILAIGILKGTPRNSDWSEQFRRANLRLILAVMWATSIVSAVFALLPAFPAFSKFSFPAPLLPIGMLMAIIAFAYPLFRLASKTGSGDQTPDSAWKLGMFYYNPGDPALMVERRFGIGYTPNFANKLSWLIILALLAVPLAALLLKKGA